MLGFYGGRGLLGLYGEQGERKVLRARAPRRPFARVRKVHRFQIRTDHTGFIFDSENENGTDHTGFRMNPLWSILGSF